MTANPAPGFAKHPDHRVDTRPAAIRVRVIFGEEVVADSRNAVRLDEAGYPPVYYFPRSDVNMTLLGRTAHGSYCPFKGQASYFAIAVANRAAENAVWSYEHPYDEVESIRERLAFYPSRVDRIEELPG